MTFFSIQNPGAKATDEPLTARLMTDDELENLKPAYMPDLHAQGLWTSLIAERLCEFCTHEDGSEVIPASFELYKVANGSFFIAPTWSFGSSARVHVTTTGDFSFKAPMVCAAITMNLVVLHELTQFKGDGDIADQRRDAMTDLNALLQYFADHASIMKMFDLELTRRATRDPVDLVERVMDAFLKGSDLSGAGPEAGDAITSVVWGHADDVIAEGVLTEIDDIVLEATRRASDEIDEIIEQDREDQDFDEDDEDEEVEEEEMETAP